MAIDRRGQKEMDVKSLQSLWGALVPILVIGLIYLVAWWFVTRHRFRDVYDPKRRRLELLEEESDRNTHARHPATRGWPGTDEDFDSECGGGGTTIPATKASNTPPVALSLAPVPPPPPPVRAAPAARGRHGAACHDRKSSSSSSTHPPTHPPTLPSPLPPTHAPAPASDTSTRCSATTPSAGS